MFSATADELKGIEGISAAHIARLSRKNIENAEKILSACSASGFRVLTLRDAEYPDRLRNIYDPPIVLYVRGYMPDVDDEAVVAVAGTRNCTPYGVSAAERTGYGLAGRGAIVVTGLARGIDSAATRGALRGQGRVMGVIGSGLDVVYPAENKSLFDDVAGNGAILSEYPPGTPALPGHFPARNRILSGLSLGVAIIEAPKKSGALITAARALEQGRDVFSLPGNVGAVSCEGSNALLREGAIPFLSADDIIAEYAGLFPDRLTEEANPGVPERNHLKKGIDNDSPVDYIDLGKILSALSGDEKTAAEIIGKEKLHIDEIIARSGLSAQQVSAALTMLEIKGFAEQGSGKIFSLTNI